MQAACLVLVAKSDCPMDPSDQGRGDRGGFRGVGHPPIFLYHIKVGQKGFSA